MSGAMERLLFLMILLRFGGLFLHRPVILGRDPRQAAEKTNDVINATVASFPSSTSPHSATGLKREENGLIVNGDAQAAAKLKDASEPRLASGETY
jgi:hypothetical protein